MFPAAATSYTVPDLILDLAIDKSHNPYEIRVNHTPPDYFDPFRTVQRFPHSENIDIHSARRGYLLTAVGRYSEADYWYTDLLNQFAGGVSEEDKAESLSLLMMKSMADQHLRPSGPMPNGRG
jgi:hypothetical protein